MEDLVVVRECGCEDPRCSTIRFVEDLEGGKLLAETVVGSRKEGGGRMVWVFAKGGELTEMEVF